MAQLVEQSAIDPKFEGSNPAAFDTSGLYYITIYGRNLRISVIS
jgi:hypothetical protein